MGFLILLLVAVATTVLAVSAATGILHVLLQLMMLPHYRREPLPVTLRPAVPPKRRSGSDSNRSH